MAHDQELHGHALEALVARIFELPIEAQLAMLRIIAPQILAWLDADSQTAYLRELVVELVEAERGEVTLELNPAQPTY